MNVYSHRFILTATPGVWSNYVVPAGKRAVLRSVSAQASGSAGGYVALGVAGVNVWLASLPGANTAGSGDFRIVAYGGELVQLYITTSMGAQLSGYLFDDPSREASAPSEPYPPFSAELGWEAEHKPG